MPITLRDLAERVRGRLEGDNGDLEIRGVAGIRDARPGEITFLAHPRYVHFMKTTRASAVVLGPDPDASGLPAIRVDHPEPAFERIVELFRPSITPPPTGVHPRAVVDPSARLGEGVSVGPLACVGPLVEIGPRTVIGPNVTIGEASRIGADCRLHSGVQVREGCLIADRVVIHCGAVIGADGFGYTIENGEHRKLPQWGIVQIDDDVEIGANTTIDRARFGRTWIQRGVKIDNLVQIAHNVVVGEYSLIVAQAGISGSAVLEPRVVLAGQSAVVGHVTVGSGTIVAARGAVSKSLPGGLVVSGLPAIPHQENKKVLVLLRRLPQLAETLRRLQEKIEKIERIERLDRIDPATADDRPGSRA